jgi:putative N-acetyltransferase (TIGR04045 family)
MTMAATEALEFSCRVARSDDERATYFALRKSIFCAEQGLFASDDRDDRDTVAHPIVCVAESHGVSVEEARVVGVVRIWEEAPGDWWGGRLGVDPDFRTAAVVGRRLVQHAVGTARAWGAWRFRATVQNANVSFFRRLRWHSIDAIDILGRPHDLMQADLDRYAPTNEPRPKHGSPPPSPSALPSSFGRVAGCDAA